MCLNPCVSLSLGIRQPIPVAHALRIDVPKGFHSLSLQLCDAFLPLLCLPSQGGSAACKVAGYIFGYGTYTGDSSTLQEETREPLIGHGTETA